MLRIHEHSIGDVMVLDVIGTIRPGAAEDTLCRTVSALVDQGHRKMLLNLAGASSADTSGISALLEALITVRARGGDLRLAHLIDGGQSIPIIVALCGYFSVFDSVEEAIASFRSSAPEPPAITGTGLSLTEVAAT